MSDASPLVVPQINVNDDSVVLVRWAVAQHAAVSAGDHVCDVETTKAVSEVAAHAGGILVQTASPGDRVHVGGTLGVIGSSVEAGTAWLASRPAQRAETGAAIAATPKAAALAAQLGVRLEAVAASGVHGTIKEADVRRHHESAPTSLPAVLAPFLEYIGQVSAFENAVAGSLRQSTSSLILTSVDMDCRLTAVHHAIRAAASGGRMVSLLHLVIGAVARALGRFDRLMTLAHGGAHYRYRAVDVAFVARATDGRLFTPVVRQANEKSVADIAMAAQAMTMAALRGRLRADDLIGAAFTISQVTVPGTSRLVALPGYGQSAILGISAEQRVVRIVDGAAVEVPIVTLTLNYDHALCDGTYAAEFLAAVVSDLESGAR